MTADELVEPMEKELEAEEALPGEKSTDCAAAEANPGAGRAPAGGHDDNVTTPSTSPAEGRAVAAIASCQLPIGRRAAFAIGTAWDKSPPCPTPDDADEEEFCAGYAETTIDRSSQSKVMARVVLSRMGKPPNDWKEDCCCCCCCPGVPVVDVVDDVEAAKLVALRVPVRAEAEPSLVMCRPSKRKRPVLPSSLTKTPRVTASTPQHVR